MYPTLLKPTDVEVFEIDNTKIKIPRCLIQFDKYEGSRSSSIITVNQFSNTSYHSILLLSDNARYGSTN